MLGTRLARTAALLAWFWTTACPSNATLGDGGGDGGPPTDGGPMLLGAGASCGQDRACASGICRGRCCLRSCGSDPTCGATGCDATGACVYPTGLCGAPSCDQSTGEETRPACALGACVTGLPSPCPGNYGCASASACATTCTGSSDCAPQNYCFDGGCSPGGQGAPCSSDAGCLSGYCGGGDAGPARCCNRACLSADPICGADGCDPRGACLYPSNVTVCAPGSCTGSLSTRPASCDGLGTCLAPISVDCQPFICGADGGCLTGCTSGADCFGGFCDLPGAACCDNFANSTIYVDGTAGGAGPCCGLTPGAGACRLLADAVRLAGESPVSGLILDVATAPADFAPVQLSYGVTVKAPGVRLPPLLILRFLPQDISTSVTVEGTAAAPVDLSGANISQVVVGQSMTLYLLNAALSGKNAQPIIQVNAGGSLELGSDGASTSGTVTLDAPAGSPAVTAIACAGTLAHPASIDDGLSQASSSVTIQNAKTHLDIGDYCTVSLVDHPVFGPPQFLPGYPDQIGLQANGAATVTISNALFQNFEYTGVLVENTNGLGPPFVQLFGSVIQNCLQYGAQCAGGNLLMSSTTVTGNDVGVAQEDDSVGQTTGTVDLSQGGDQINCNIHWDVINTAAGAGFNAQNVAWDKWDPDAGHTEIWTCDFMGSGGCTCTGAASCSLYGGAIELGADIVLSSIALSVDDTGGSQVANPCP